MSNAQSEEKVSRRMQQKPENSQPLHKMGATATAFAQSASALPIELCAPVRRIVTFHSGSLREFLFALPALKTLRETFDGAHICVVLRKDLAHLLENSSLVDEILLRPEGGLSSQAGLMARLHAHHFDMALAFSTSRKSTLLAWSSGAPIRIGFDGARMEALLTHRVEKDASQPLSIAAMLDLARAAGCAPRCQDYTDTIQPAIEFEKEAQRILQEKQIASPFLLVAPQPEEGSKTKITWAVALSALAKRYPIVLVGSKSNRELIREVGKEVPSASLHDLSGNLETPLVAALCGKAQLFVGCAGGLAHLAAAVNTPGVVVYGEKMQRDIYEPRGVAHRLLRDDCSHEEIHQAVRELIGL
jgi:ADP-heptose:LPS heptosyltransferase